MDNGVKVLVGVGVVGAAGVAAVALLRPQWLGLGPATPAQAAPPLPAVPPGATPAPLPAAGAPVPAGGIAGKVARSHTQHPPGPLVTVMGHGKVAGHWTVGADGVTLTGVGTEPMTPALKAQADHDAALAKPAPRGAPPAAGSPASAARPGAPPSAPLALPGAPASPLSALPPIPASPAGALAAGQNLLGPAGGAAAGAVGGLLGGGDPAASSAPDAGAGGGTDPALGLAVGSKWRMVDLTWQPFALPATTEDKRAAGFSPSAEVFWFSRDGAVTDQGELGQFLRPSEPWRGAALTQGGRILPTLTNGVVAGLPADPFDWTKGIA